MQLESFLSAFHDSALQGLLRMYISRDRFGANQLFTPANKQLVHEALVLTQARVLRLRRADGQAGAEDSPTGGRGAEMDRIMELFYQVREHKRSWDRLHAKDSSLFQSSGWKGARSVGQSVRKSNAAHARKTREQGKGSEGDEQGRGGVDLDAEVTEPPCARVHDDCCDDVAAYPSPPFVVESHGGAARPQKLNILCNFFAFSFACIGVCIYTRTCRHMHADTSY